MKSSIVLICLTLISSVRLAISKECKTPTQVAGICTDLKDCVLLYDLLQREQAQAADFLRESICHYEGKNPIVCCPGKPGQSTEQNLYGPLFPPQCGFTNVSNTRIVGGEPAKLDAWPWMAALGFVFNPDIGVEFRCGGTLISARHVLTAAHCAVSNNLTVIRLGDLNVASDDDGAHPIDVGIDKKIIHPTFLNKMRNDIAIIRLDREIQFTYSIHPICLPVGDIQHEDFVGTNPFLAGWGMLSYRGNYSNELMQVEVPVISVEACKKIYYSITGFFDYEELICTGGPGGKDSCQGDSGGPVMLPRSGSYYDIGVIINGGKCADPNFPGINTRVTSHLHFIISNLQ